jgi:hypothetical protein
MAVFLVLAACFLVVARSMDAARTSETLVYFYQTTRRYNPEDSHLGSSSAGQEFPCFTESRLSSNCSQKPAYS